MKPLNIIFAGTPDFAARHLQALIDSPHNILAVYTQPDKPAGRGKKLTASPVKILALENQLEIFQPASLRNEDAQHTLSSLNADLMIVVAYGLILPKAVLAAPKMGCINVHGSILPKWRGAAPIQRSIWAGDKRTGVTIMQMDEGLDTGDMLVKAEIDIEDSDTSASLYHKLAELGPKALLSTLEQIANGTANPEKQDASLVTYAEKLSKEEARLDWTKTATQLWQEIRAFNPWPVSHFEHQDQTIKVWQASVEHKQSSEQSGTILQIDKTGLYIATAENILVIEKLQLAGKKTMSIGDILNGRADLFQLGAVIQALDVKA